MFKKLSLLTIGTLTAASLSACSSGAGGDAAKPAAGASPSPAASSASGSGQAAAAKTKITYWTPDRGATDHIKAEVAKYNETNKDNIEVEVNIMAENYEQSLDVAFASNQAPDIIRVNNPTNFPVFVKKGYLEPLDGLLTPEMKTRFGPLLAEGVNQSGGKTYTLPNYGITQRLIYNVDLFEKAGIKEPPKTLKELVEDAKKLTEAGKPTGAYGIAANMKSTGSAVGRFSDPITGLSGANVQGYNFAAGKYDFAQMKPVIEAYRQMKQDGSFIPGVELLDIDPLRAQFAEGKIGMYFSNASEPLVYKNQFPAKIKWSSALPPTADGTMNGVIPVGNAGIFLGLNAKSQHKAEAWKFLQYMYSDDVLKSYQEDGIGISVVPSVLEKAKKPDINGIDGFLPTKYDAVYPPVPAVAVQGMNFQETFLKYILSGGDLDKTIEDLDTRYNAALDKAKSSGSVKADPIAGFDAKKLQGSLAK